MFCKFFSDSLDTAGQSEGIDGCSCCFFCNGGERGRGRGGDERWGGRGAGEEGGGGSGQSQGSRKYGWKEDEITCSSIQKVCVFTSCSFPYTHTSIPRFLTIVETSVGTGNEFSLDMMAQNLGTNHSPNPHTASYIIPISMVTGTNRRRIYDIINVMEALEMIVKQSKNWYTWNGRSGLLNTLAKLKVMDNS